MFTRIRQHTRNVWNLCKPSKLVSKTISYEKQMSKYTNRSRTNQTFKHRQRFIDVEVGKDYKIHVVKPSNAINDDETSACVFCRKPTAAIDLSVCNCGRQLQGRPPLWACWVRPRGSVTYGGIVLIISASKSTFYEPVILNKTGICHQMGLHVSYRLEHWTVVHSCSRSFTWDQSTGHTSNPDINYN